MKKKKKKKKVSVPNLQVSSNPLHPVLLILEGLGASLFLVQMSFDDVYRMSSVFYCCTMSNITHQQLGLKVQRLSQFLLPSLGEN